ADQRQVLPGGSERIEFWKSPFVLGRLPRSQPARCGFLRGTAVFGTIRECRNVFRRPARSRPERSSGTYRRAIVPSPYFSRHHPSQRQTRRLPERLRLGALRTPLNGTGGRASPSHKRTILHNSARDPIAPIATDVAQNRPLDLHSVTIPHS